MLAPFSPTLQPLRPALDLEPSDLTLAPDASPEAVGDHCAPLRISVLGTGYLGATHAAGLAELGHEVVGVDIDGEKIGALAAGRVPFHEPDLEALLARHVRSGQLRFTNILQALPRSGSAPAGKSQ